MRSRSKSTSFSGRVCLLIVMSLSIPVAVVTASGAQETVVHSFPQTNAFPAQSLVADSSGTLYGTLSGDTSSPDGAVFELSPPTSGKGAWTEKTLFTFNGTDGNGPSSPLLRDARGNLYGTTRAGGNGPCLSGNISGCGVVFELSPSSDGSWTEETLHSFQGGDSDGSAPSGALGLDSAGNLYGSTQEGTGTNCLQNLGCGMVYRLEPSSSGSWSEQILYKFSGGSDGWYPVGVTLANGALYGTTSFGGTAASAGVVYELQSVGGAVKQSVLYAFTGGADGGMPTQTVVVGAGHIYGAAGIDGKYSWGNVFELSSSGGQWTETVLYNFTGGADGGNPFAPLTRDGAGNLYSTTYTGGNTNDCGWENPFDGCGVVFRVSPPSVQGNPWTETVLHAFTDTGSDGNLPQDSGVIFGKGGYLFGTTAYGGTGGCTGERGITFNCGTVYGVVK